MGSFARRLGYTGRGGGGGGGSPLDAQLRALGIDVSQPPPTSTPQGPLGKVGGFVGNLVGNIGEMGAGLAGLAGIAMHDVYQGAADIADIPLSALGKDNPNRDYYSDDLAKALVFDPDTYKKQGLSAAIAPGIQEYLEESYGINPVKGDLAPELGKVAHTAYHQPLDLGLDLLGGATLGGRFAAKSATKAAKAGSRTPMVKRVLPGLDPDSPLYDAGLIEKGKVVRKPETYAGGVRKRMREHGGQPQLIETKLPLNPVTRGMRTGISNAASRDIEKLPPEVVALAKKIGKMDPDKQLMEMQALTSDVAEQVRLYNRAQELGVTRLDAGPVAQMKVKVEAAKRLALWTANTYRLRNEDMKKVLDAFETSGLSEADLKMFHQYAQGLRRTTSPGTMQLDDAVTMLRRQGDAADPELVKAFDQLQEYVEQKQTVLMSKADEAGGGVATITDEITDLQDEIDSARAYAEDLSEALFLNPKSDRFQVAMSKIRLARHDLVHQSVERNLLGGYKEIMRRQYGPMLIEDNAALVKKAGRTFSFDELAGEGNFWRTKRDAMRAEKSSAPVYFPHLDARRFQRSDFTLKRGMAMEKLTGRAPYKKNEYRLFLDGTNLMDDPIEAYARRQAHMRRIIETQKFVEDIAMTFGRKIGRMDELSNTEKAFNPQAIKQLYRTRGEMDDALAVVGNIADETKLADALVDVEAKLTLPAGQGGQLYAIPAAVANKLESYSRYQLGPMARLFWDSPTNAWRSAVLSFSPRWIFNNLLGNITFLKMQGGRLSDVLAQIMSPKFRKRLDEWIDSLPPEVQASINGGLYSSAETNVTHLGAAERTVSGALLSKGAQSKAVRPLQKASHKMQHFNNIIEEHFRRASFVRGAERQLAERGLKQSGRSFVASHETLERLAKNGLTEGEIGKAISEVNYFLNDYRKLGSAERNIMRRFMMPFYSFYKHVARLTLTYPLVHPERAAVLRMMGELSREMNEELGDLPDYMAGAFPIGEGESEGSTRFLNARNAMPIMQFTEGLQDPRDVLSMMHPGLKAPLEHMTGRDTFTGRPFTSPDAGGGFGSDEQFKAVYDDQGNIVNVTSDPTNVRPGFLETIGRQIPQWELGKDLVSLIPGVGEPGVGARYSTGEEIMRGGETAYPRNALQSVGRMLGVSTTDLDVDKFQQRRLENRRAAIIQILRNLGLMAPSE